MNHEVQLSTAENMPAVENLSMDVANQPLADQQTTAEPPGSKKPAIIDRQPPAIRPCSNRLSTAKSAPSTDDKVLPENNLEQIAHR